MGLISRIKECLRIVTILSSLRDTDSFMEWDELYNDLTYGSFGQTKWIISYGHRMEGRDEWRYAIVFAGDAIRALNLDFFWSLYYFDPERKRKEVVKNIVDSVRTFTNQSDWARNPVAGDRATTTEVLVENHLVAIRRHNRAWFAQRIKCRHCPDGVSVLRDKDFRLVMLKIKPETEVFNDPDKALEWAKSLDWKSIRSR